MRGASDRRHARLKKTWLRALRAGAGCLVIAAAVVGTAPARAATPPGTSSVEERVQHAREALLPDAGAVDRKKLDELAFWGNRIGIGIGVRPVWPNWPNWHNWHNWPNGWGNGAWANF